MVGGALMIKEGEVFNGLVIRTHDGRKIGRVTSLTVKRDQTMRKVYELTYSIGGEEMEKYGVEIDPKKIDEAKKKQAPGEKTAGVDDPNTNVPLDPNKGTEPFEKKPEGE
jgi:hypothetical protein